MKRSPFIGLELHDKTIWEPSRVLPIVETMKRWGYNALVLHQNDLLDECTQLGLTANYGVSDLRLKKTRNRAAWLVDLTRRLAEFNAKLFLEIKEPSFDDYVLENWPQLLGQGGQPDPTKPEWAEFCEAKTRDLLARVPNIGGFIVNLSSPESRVSMPDHRDDHADGADQGPWFDRMIGAFQRPLAEAGAKLYVRDFSYTTDLQSDVLAAVERCEGAVRASVKVTAHDYFPRSKENPVIQSVGVDDIVEFDAFGEHTGWGVIPNYRVDEFSNRIAAYKDGGPKGVLVRTSWEAITGANALDSLSAVNVFALARFAQGDDDPDLVSLAWLAQTYDLKGDLADQVLSLLKQSWNIPAAAYWNDEVFPRHSCLPSTWREGWMSMETIGMGRRDRTLAILPDDSRLSDEAKDALFADKEAASALAEELATRAAALSSKLPSKLSKLMSDFAALPLFAKQFELATKAAFFAARDHAGMGGLPDTYADQLLALAEEMASFVEGKSDQLHHHQVLLDPDQIRLFVRSLPSKQN